MTRRHHLIRAIRRHERKLRRLKLPSWSIQDFHVQGLSATSVHTYFQDQLRRDTEEWLKKISGVLLPNVPSFNISFGIPQQRLMTLNAALVWCEAWAKIHNHDLLRFELVEQRDGFITIVLVGRNDERPNELLAADLQKSISPMLPVGQFAEVYVTSRADALWMETPPDRLLIAAIVYPDEVRANPIVPLYALQDPPAFAHLMPAPSPPVGTLEGPCTTPPCSEPRPAPSPSSSPRCTASSPTA
ncbi:MAG: hypothetical protein EOO74_03935 [Myxococcales bacterium]|nr:MAG: hypothetical protein EOO74_03935 [Myxococcales bacterium]